MTRDLAVRPRLQRDSLSERRENGRARQNPRGGPRTAATGPVEGVLECNQMPNPTGQAPKQSNVLPRIFTGHHWASLGITGHHWALRASLAWSHGDFFVCRIPHKTTQRPIPIKCAVSRDTRTGTSARRLDIKTVITPGHHCTWDSSSTRGA